MKAGILKTSFVLLLLCAVCGGAVASIWALASPKIAANREKEVQEAILSVYPESEQMNVQELSGEGVEKFEHFFYYTDPQSGEGRAYAAILSPKGFQDIIRMCVVTDEKGVILGVKVLSASETPGVGDRACSDSYLQGYRNLSGPLRFGDGIDAISGATVSSRTVLQAVNDVSLAVQEQIEKGEG